MAYLLPHLLSESAQRRPEANALSFEGANFSYGALETIANRVARALSQVGVRGGDRVGIYLPKSAESVMAIYGIHKAGAAYVPLDPNAPPARLGYIVGNCDIDCLVSATLQ